MVLFRSGILAAAAVLIPIFCAAQIERVEPEGASASVGPSVSAPEARGWASDLGALFNSGYPYSGQMDAAENAAIALAVLPANNAGILKALEPVRWTIAEAKKNLLGPESLAGSSFRPSASESYARAAKLQTLRIFEGRLGPEERPELDRRLDIHRGAISEEQRQELLGRQRAVEEEMQRILRNMYGLGVFSWMTAPETESASALSEAAAPAQDLRSGDKGEATNPSARPQEKSGPEEDQDWKSGPDGTF